MDGCGCGVGSGMLTFLALAYMFDATQDYGLGCGEWCQRSLNLLTCLMLRKIMGWGVGNDVNVPWTCLHVVATEDYGLGCGERCQRSLNLLTCLMLRKIMGRGVGNDFNIPWTCLHVWCYRRLWVGVWGMKLLFLELAYMFDATEDYGLGCGKSKRWTRPKKNRLLQGLGNLEFENTMEIPQNQVKVLENTQNFAVYQNDKTNKVL